MSRVDKASLANEVSRAEAREAREARLAGLEPPSCHLGGPPEPWEEAIGDTTERVARQGRTVGEYAAKMNAMGIYERSTAGDNNPVADHVASMGREKMRLLRGQPRSTLKAEALKGRKGGALGTTVQEEDDASVSSVDLSDFTDDDIHDDKTEKKASSPSKRESATGAEEPFDESSDGIGLMEDRDLRNAVEDFDASNWTLDQLEVSCQTLLEECYASEDRRRRMLSAGMLFKLVETYPSASRWMQRNLEAVVDDGLPSMVKGTLGTRVFKLDYLLGILAPCMAESMTQLNVMARILRLMMFKMDTAVRVISFRYMLPKLMTCYRALPRAIYTYKCMTLLMQGSSLRSRWRKVNANEQNGSLPPGLLHAYLCIILALIDKETCPMYFRMNRVKMVSGGGLLALAVHFKDGDRSQRLACRIFRELAREPLLIYELVKADMARHLARLLPKLRETSIARLLEALDALDSMAFSAMKFCELKSTVVGSKGEGNSAVLAALVADGSDTGGLESELSLPAGRKVEDTVKEQLGFTPLVSSLTSLLEETDVQLYLAGVVILGKLASTVCYHSVLQEMLAYAGRALERLIQGVQSREEIVPEMSVALFLQLCSRQEGRDGIEASDGAAMLLPIISGRHAQASPAFFRGLACAVALSRHEGVPNDTSAPIAPARGRRLPRAGGVGLSGPARPHHLDLEGKLYNDLVDMLDAPPPAPQEAVRGLVRMGFLDPVMRFLVPDDNTEEQRVSAGGAHFEAGRGSVGKKGGLKGCSELAGPHFFRLKQRHACLGAVALHGLIILAGPHPAIFQGKTLRYLCYAIQVTYIDLTVGTLARGVGYPLVFRSIQLACRAMACLATSDVDVLHVPQNDEQGKADETSGALGDGDEHEEVAAGHGALRRVADSLLSTSAINEVACMAQMPSRAALVGDEGVMYRHLERTVISAAMLIASVCPVPASERDPFTRFDEPEDEKASLCQCLPLMERLVRVVGSPLCSTLMVVDNLEIIAHACRALAKLSEANTSVQMLLDSHNVMKAIIRLGPKAPAVLPRSNKRRPAARDDDVRQEQEARRVSRSRSPTRPLGHSRNDNNTAREIGATAGRWDIVDQESRRNNWQQDHNSEQVEGRMKERRRSGEQTSSALRDSGMSLSSNGHVSGARDKARRRDGADQESKRQNGSSWVGGYEVREGAIADTSTRKLCSLPFDYFRLVANVARVPCGRAVVQSSGALKRSLERLALDVTGGLAACRATMRCRSEVCVLLARMAGTYDRETGAANDFILAPRYRALEVLIGMMVTGWGYRRAEYSEEWLVVEVARHNAALALAALCSDGMRSIPLVAEAGGLAVACGLVKDRTSPIPLLKQVLLVLAAAASFPDGAYASSLADPVLLGSLNRIANTAYPGFRHVQPGGDGSSLSSPIHKAMASQFLSGARPTTSPIGSPKGGVAKSAGCDEWASAFGLPKRNSPDGHLISELAREVAYLIGERRQHTLPAMTSSLKLGRHTTTSSTAQPAGKNPTPIQQKSAKSGGASSGDTHNGKKPEVEVLNQRRISQQTSRSGKDEERKSEPMVGAVAPEILTVTETVVSGRPGTYLGCGVTSCTGLGYTGEHGSADGNVAHPPFVLKGGIICRESRSGEIRRGGDDETDVDPTSVNKGCLDAHECRSKTQGEAGREHAPPQQAVEAIPLALVSAEDSFFREELIRRKEHYGPGGTGKPTHFLLSTQEDTLTLENALTAPCCKGARVRAGRTQDTAAEAAQRSRQMVDRRDGRGKRSGVLSPVFIDATTSPLLASTRPFGVHPSPATSAVEHELDTTILAAVTNPPTVEKRESTDATESRCAPTKQECVTFARPAAHWSVTAGIPGRGTAEGRGSSPGRHAPTKECVRVEGRRSPDDGGAATVVGRFACRGYLLDPTFTDLNPIIQHPRLPRIGVRGRGGDGALSHAPEGTTLADLVASQIAKGIGNGGKRGTVEPYRNAVEVMHHYVSVSGTRKAGRQRFFDENGIPMSPVNFHHVFDCAEKRRCAHAEPNVIPFP